MGDRFPGRGSEDGPEPFRLFYLGLVLQTQHPRLMSTWGAGSRDTAPALLELAVCPHESFIYSFIHASRPSPIPKRVTAPKG